ncbi:hypothetical protein [Ignavigranum ruoffiae]|uniref:hypothetical protein n=1 Tax=Ignavigranum ruoffiae TaxID=89093 RepID=UPI00235216C3|nr:hypothetical protein [Ignavigranum ruoffiae]
MVEKIIFNEFDSSEFDLKLISRDAPSPEEKEVAESVPYKQGKDDFSMIYGQRPFENRLITYTFLAPNVSYEDSKLMEINIKQLLMLNGKNRLFDSHDQGYYWLGKCKSVTFQDEREYRSAQVIIEFDVYPFMFDDSTWFDDLTVNAKTNGVAQWTKHEVKYEKEFIIINNGDRRVHPEIIVNSVAPPPLIRKSVFTPAKPMYLYYYPSLPDYPLIEDAEWSKAQGFEDKKYIELRDIEEVTFYLSDGTQVHRKGKWLGFEMIFSNGELSALFTHFENKTVPDGMPTIKKLVSKIEVIYTNDYTDEVSFNRYETKTEIFEFASNKVVAFNGFWKTPNYLVEDDVSYTGVVIGQEEWKRAFPNVNPELVDKIEFEYDLFESYHQEGSFKISYDGKWIMQPIIVNSMPSYIWNGVKEGTKTSSNRIFIYRAKITHSKLVSRGTTEVVGYKGYENQSFIL